MRYERVALWCCCGYGPLRQPPRHDRHPPDLRPRPEAPQHHAVERPRPFPLHGASQVAGCGRRLTRSKLLAKRPHSGGHWPRKKLNNVGEDIRFFTHLSLVCVSFITYEHDKIKFPDQVSLALFFTSFFTPWEVYLSTILADVWLISMSTAAPFEYQ